MKIGRLILRAAVGGFFVGHGTQKLFGWFGGQGLKAQAESFDKMGLKPGIVHAGAAGVAEAAGGAGLLLGYRTPLASASIVSVMLTAINRVHLTNGPWAKNGGYEYNVVLAAAALSLAESGPGALSLDALRGKEREGARWSLFSLALGAVAAAGAHFLAESRATPAPMPESTPAPAPPTAAEVGGVADQVQAVHDPDTQGQQPHDGEPEVEAAAQEPAADGDSAES